MEQAPTTPEVAENQNASQFWKEFFKIALLALVVVVPFRVFIAQPFIVEGASMYPTFSNGDYLIIDQLTYRFEEPERGSVLVFRYPRDPQKFFIKRVIGLPGDTITIREGRVEISNLETGEKLTLDEPYVERPRAETLNFSVKEGEYFVMGDNRAGSADSRIWGAVPRDNIVGRPVLRLFPPALMPGDMRKLITN